MKTEPVSKNSLTPFKLKSLQVILLFFQLSLIELTLPFCPRQLVQYEVSFSEGDECKTNSETLCDFRKQSEPVSTTLTRFKSFLFFFLALPAQLLLRVLEKSNMLNMEHFVCCLDIYFLIWSQLFPIEMYLYINFFPAPSL